MDENLKKLQEANRNLKSARAEFKHYKERWYSWNYWAWRKHWYDQWFDEHNLKTKNIRAMKKIARTDVVYEKYAGWKYYNEWVGANQAISDLEDEFDNIFEYCWFLKAKGRQKKTRTGHVYNDEMLGEALECKPRSVYKRAEERYWYEPRKKQNADSIQ